MEKVLKKQDYREVLAKEIAEYDNEEIIKEEPPENFTGEEESEVTPKVIDEHLKSENPLILESKATEDAEEPAQVNMEDSADGADEQPRSVEKPAKKNKLIIIGAVALAVLGLVAFLLLNPHGENTKNKWPEGDVTPKEENPSQVPLDKEVVNDKNEELWRSIGCESDSCYYLANDDIYFLYRDGNTTILRNRLTREVLAEFEAVSEAEFYTALSYVDYSEIEHHLGLILRKEATVAFYSFAANKITIPFGKYDDFVTEIDIYEPLKVENINFILTKSSKGQQEKMGAVNIKTGKEIVPCKYYDIDYYSPGVFIISLFNNNEYEQYGLYDSDSGKELLPVKYEFIECGSYACGIWDKDWNIQVYDLKKKQWLDISDKYQNDKEVAKMRDTVNIFGCFDLGTKEINDMNNLSNKLKLMIADFARPYQEDQEEIGVKAEEITKSMEKLFGPGFIFTHGNIPCFYNDKHVSLKYDKKKNLYIDVEEGHGGGGYFNCYDAVVEYQVLDDIHEVTVKRLFVYSDDGGYDQDAYGDILGKVKLFKVNVPEGEDVSIADILWYYFQKLESYQGKSPAYKYTFRKDGDNYYLVGYQFIPAK